MLMRFISSFHVCSRCPDVAFSCHGLQRSKSHARCSWRADTTGQKIAVKATLSATVRAVELPSMIPLSWCLLMSDWSAEWLIDWLIEWLIVWRVLAFSTELVVVGLHQRLLLLLVVTRLVTGAVAALGLITHFALRYLLLHILVN